MKCQRARQARGLLVFGPSCLQTICPDGWSREGLLSMPLNHSRDPGAWESTCLSSFPPPTPTTPTPLETQGNPNKDFRRAIQELDMQREVRGERGRGTGYGKGFAGCICSA